MKATRNDKASRSRSSSAPRTTGGSTLSPPKYGVRAVDGSPPSTARIPNKTGMPDSLKAGVERLSGHSMDDVRVQYNSPRPAQVGARAYAQGTTIHVAPRQEKFLAHEAWHVAQQKQGRVQPTKWIRGMGINDDSSLEHEADVMGTKASSLGRSLQGSDPS